MMFILDWILLSGYQIQMPNGLNHWNLLALMVFISFNVIVIIQLLGTNTSDHKIIWSNYEWIWCKSSSFRGKIVPSIGFLFLIKNCNKHWLWLRALMPLQPAISSPIWGQAPDIISLLPTLILLQKYWKYRKYWQCLQTN